ncbi:MAG TPA: hypothetical protein VFR23_26110 [Jiangellaceae bacterium]|nr:hypothetical protein [Jiangellaceae bacterium]
MANPTFRDFPGLAAQERQADKTADLLQQAARVASAMVPGEDWASQAERLRQAAVYAGIAVNELYVSIGWYSAAASASEAGILETNEGSELT